jgi:predicted metal-dependent HD superfamily phosphohydrolase
MTDLRWDSAWQGLGLVPGPKLHAEILRAYRKPHRAYHTLDHLAECFEHLDTARQHADRLAEIQIAIWFHDSFYDTWRSDNEERSAAWARTALLDAGASAEVAERVFAMVLATKSHDVAASNDMALLVDIDLAILGARPPRFAEYQRQIREEYRWVPAFMFQRRRKEFLEHLLARPRIYHTDFFRGRLETAARRNIELVLEHPPELDDSIAPF